jgi:hypothetical protein
LCFCVSELSDDVLLLLLLPLPVPPLRKRLNYSSTL